MLLSPADFAGALNTSLAFAIKRSDQDRKQKHVALLYRNIDSTWRLLHFGWHHLLVHEAWNGEYHWLPLDGLAPEVTEGLADLAVIVATNQANGQIPYSVAFSPGQYFDENLTYSRHAAGEGLTCATFILAVFRRWGLPLIDESTWPRGRNQDSSWALKIIRVLFRWGKKYGVPIPIQHLAEQVRQRKTLRRFRPEEVCACADPFFGEPLPFSVVEPLSLQVLRELP